MKQDKKYKLIKKIAKPNLPYKISVTPTCLDSYNRGKKCLFYIQLLKTKVKTTKQVDNCVYLDYDRKGRLVGVEII